MTTAVIYTSTGEQIIEAPITKDAKIVCKLGVEHYIELPFTHDTILPLVRGCYIIYNDNIYYLRRNAAPEALSSADGYKYTLKLYSRQHLMEDRVLRWMSGSNHEVTFSLTTNLETYASLLCDNMNAYMSGGNAALWIYNAIPTELSSLTQALTFNGVSCWQAMSDIANAFGVEWWVEETDIWVGTEKKHVIIINFGKCGNGEYIDIVEGNIVKRFPPAKRGEDSNFGTRFYVYGGTKNIPNDYYEDVTGGTTNHISEKRLHLPNGVEYIDAVDGLSDTEIIEKALILDDIYPTNTNTITAIDIKPMKLVEWEDITDVYVIEASNTNFSGRNDDILGTLGITFTSGALKGRSFDVSINKAIGSDTFDCKFEIVAQVEGEGGSSQIVVPNDNLKPAIGDTFILTGIKLPRENVTEAETKLLIAARGYVGEYYADTNVYDCNTNPVYCQVNDINMGLGQKVRLVGAHFGVDGRKSRVQGYEKRLYNEYQAMYNIGDNNTYSKTLSVIDTGLKVSVSKIKEQRTESKNEFHQIKVLSQEAGSLTNMVNALIGDDYWKSAREIASEVVDSAIPTEIATATQRKGVTTDSMLLSLSPNILYDWGTQTLDSLTLPSLRGGDNAYNNKWMVRFALLSSNNLTIPFNVFWKDGIAPSWSAWCVCEITFFKDAAGVYTYGEWKVYK
jgi:hypothetical protein